MAHPQIAAFARLAEGGAKPTRRIEGQTTLLGRTMHSIAYDPVHDEFTVPQQFGQAILTFRGGASGEEPPIRVIQGSLTQLIDPDRLDVDPVHNEIFVPQGDSVLVFPREARGDVAPIRVLKGPNTQLGASAVAVDPANNLLIVVGSWQRSGPRIRIFNRTDEGNVKPRAVIGGPKSGFKSLGGPFALYPPRGWIIASVRPTGEVLASSEESFVGVWSIHDNGDVPPRWTIGGPKGILQMPRGVALDPKNKSLIVTDKRLNAVLTFYFPEIF
ncbi:MAG: hypothetical protein HY652_06830 [Acidobacteria bacterium]|nr:hypothetical protein [Acidobacteriota bacterium]